MGATIFGKGFIIGSFFCSIIGGRGIIGSYFGAIKG
jgi:hypothetical protein